MKNIKLTPVIMALICGMFTTNTGWAEYSVGDRVKDWIEKGSDSLKSGIDKLGDNFEAIQDYLNNYHWKGIVEDKATSGPATLENLQMNGRGHAIVVHPGERIKAKVDCHLDREKCSSLGYYQIVMGLNGDGPQTTIGNELGLVAGDTTEKFKLVAPDQPGIYQVQFRTVDAIRTSTALNAWKDDHGNEPGSKTTIGIVVVK